MSHHKQLLDQARRLSAARPGQAQQADFRRAVSSAYYALFHFLIAEACRYLLGGAKSDQAMRAILGRAFDHGEMAKASRSFEGGTLPAAMAPHLGSVPQPLRDLAEAFREIQVLRHRADYDFTPGSDFFLKDVSDVIVAVEAAMANWAKVSKLPIARFYLISLLTWNKMEGRR